MAGRDDSELDRAVEEYQAEQPVQMLLLAEDAAELPEGPRGRGRPPGSRNLRSEAYAALLRQRHGDPLDIATKVAAIDILDRKNVENLAEAWGCKRHEAVKLWAQVNRDVMPYVHQQLPRAVVLNPGAPGGDRVLVEIDGDFREVPDGYEDAA